MSSPDYRNHVLAFIREYIHQTHRFPSCTEIVEEIDISKPKCQEICQELVDAKELYIVFEGKGKPRVFVPYDMMQGLLRTQSKPSWIDDITFSDEPKLIRQAKKSQEALVRYDIFKRLLYGTGIPLEESISYCLDLLGFHNVVHQKDDPDNPDITFEYEGIEALVEVEGTKKAGLKPKVLQLEGWVQRECSAGKSLDELKGIYAINHYREEEPKSRSEPLTHHAKEFMKRYNFVLITTPTLFAIIKDVMEGNLSKEDARAKVWKGDEIE